MSVVQSASSSSSRRLILSLNHGILVYPYAMASLQITWMPRVSLGLNNFWINSKEPLFVLHTTDTFWKMSLNGYWN